MTTNAPKELLQGKVTKESLEDIAAKEANRLEARLPWLFFIPVAIVLLALVVPAVGWWVLLGAMSAFAVYFKVQQHKLETLQGRAAGRKSRRPGNVSHAY